MVYTGWQLHETISIYRANARHEVRYTYGYLEKGPYDLFKLLLTYEIIAKIVEETDTQRRRKPK